MDANKKVRLLLVHLIILFFSCCFIRIFCGCPPEMLFEDRGEIGLIVEAHRIGYLCDVDFSLTDEACSLLQTQVANELSCRDARDLLHLHIAGQH